MLLCGIGWCNELNGIRALPNTDTLPVQQVQASQFSLHISYFLQNCKKGKPPKKDLPLLKNDITGSEPAFGIANI